MVESCYIETSRVVSGLNCVVAFETAADCLGICDMAFERPAVYVYSTEELNVDGIECTVVESYDNMEVTKIGSILCTSVSQTICDLLRYDRDDQVILESLADWYFSHGDSFDGLEIPDDLREIFDSYVEDAIHYYDY